MAILLKAVGQAVVLALLTSPALSQTTLNLSQHLVPLGIAATNMLPNQPTLDAGPLFMAGVDYAKNNGISTVIADPGAYYFLSVNVNTHVFVFGIDNMTIDLHGADLIFTHPLYYGLIVYYSMNAVIQNFTTDYQPLPFTQVRVTAVDVPNGRIQYVVEPGWPDPSTFNAFSTFAGASVPQVQVHVFRGGREISGRLFSQLPIGGGGTLFILSADPGTSLGNVRAGDVAVVALNSGSSAVVTTHCNGCTLRNVIVLSSSYDAVIASDTQNSLMERVYTIPKPGTDRLMSSSAGIFMAAIAGPNNQIRFSRAIRTFDDGIAVWGRILGTVQGQVSARVLVVDGSGPGGTSVLGDGDAIPNGAPVTFERYSDGTTIAIAVIVSQSTPDPAYPHRTTFTFDRDLPAGVIGAAVYTTDANQDGANSVLERNLIQEPAGRMYIGGIANSTVRGNYIRRTIMSGIFLYHASGGDGPTAPLTNMTIGNNVIDGANMVPHWWWYKFGGISSVTLTPAYDLMTGHPMSNLDITNNFIADAGRSGVWLGNTSGGSVTGNYILNANLRPDLANAYPPRIGDATRPLVVDTTSTGVTVASNTIDNTSGTMFVTDTLYRELAAYAPGGTIRLNAYGVGGLSSPVLTLTDADGQTRTMTLLSTTTHALDVQIPAATALGGAYVTLTSGGQKSFGTLFVDSQDNIPAVNGCTYEASPSSTSVPGAASSVPILVVTQAGCAYPVVATDPFVTVPGGGTGTGVITVGLGANPGPARTATIEIAGQPITLTQDAVGLGFYALPPCRVLDTRSPDGPYGGPAIAVGPDRTFVLTGRCGIPVAAKAVSLNATVTQPTAAGDVRLYPGGISLPLISTTSYRAGQTRANNAVLGLGPAGDLLVHNDQLFGSVHLIIDVNGYFQ